MLNILRFLHNTLLCYNLFKNKEQVSRSNLDLRSTLHRAEKYNFVIVFLHSSQSTEQTLKQK